MKLINDLKTHDWYYNYSDDFSVWDRGNKAEDLLVKELATLIPNQALLLIETHVPKQFHEQYAYRVTSERAKK